MDEESANWCRLAQTIMQKGGEVLRQFLQLEILTKIYIKYSRFWMNNVHNPGDINYLAILVNNFNRILKGSHNASGKMFNALLDSWSRNQGQRMTVIQQIYRLKEWKLNIDNERLNSVLRSDREILESWLSQIEQEIQKLNSMWTVLSQWNNTFHCHLQNAQIGLLLEIEKNDDFLSRCIHTLKSLSKPSSSEFQQLIQNFKVKLTSWKMKCCRVLQRLNEECRALITLGLREAQAVPQSHVMVTFLNGFKKKISDGISQADIELFCDNWDTDLHDIFDTYEKKIPKDDSSSSIFSLAQSLCEALENFTSFKEKKIQNFLFTSSKIPGLSHLQRSKLKDISGSLDLNEFDFTLLVAVLINGDFVHSPLSGRDSDPHDWDTSLSADILRLRAYRNNIVENIAQTRISSDTFEKLWKELTMLLRKIASRCGETFNMKISFELDQMKDRPLEPHRELKLRQQFLMWFKTDIETQLSPRSPAHHLCQHLLQSIKRAEKNLSTTKQARTCLRCNNEFSTESEFAEHVMNHKVCTCRHCNQECSNESKLAQNMVIHKAGSESAPDNLVYGMAAGAIAGSVLGPSGTVAGALFGGTLGFLRSVFR